MISCKYYESLRVININLTIILSVPCLFNKLTIFHYQVFLRGYSSFNFANWELDFLFLLLFLCFFSLMTSSSTKISKSTRLKTQKFVTIHISEICNCFYKINFLSDMARIVKHYITPSLLSIILFTIVLGQWEHKNFYTFQTIIMTKNTYPLMDLPNMIMMLNQPPIHFHIFFLPDITKPK